MRWPSISTPASPIWRRSRPTEFLLGTGRAGGHAARVAEDTEPLTPADIEKQQSIWWFLLLAGLVALLAEAVLANRHRARPVHGGGSAIAERPRGVLARAPDVDL